MCRHMLMDLAKRICMHGGLDRMAAWSCVVVILLLLLLDGPVQIAQLPLL